MKTAHFITYWLGSLASLGMGVACLSVQIIELAICLILLAVLFASGAFRVGWTLSRENLRAGRIMMGLAAIPFIAGFLMLFG